MQPNQTPIKRGKKISPPIKKTEKNTREIKSKNILVQTHNEVGEKKSVGEKQKRKKSAKK